MRGRCPAVVVILLAALAGCGGSGSNEGGDRQLRVLAASSLTEPLDALADEFEADHPGVSVTAIYGSSATLASQVIEGAPADVLATADLDTMTTVEEAGAVLGPTSFAGNRLVLVTPADNPAGLSSFADLSSSEVTFVACVETAPCGKVARALLDRNGVPTQPRSLEIDVKAVLTKVTTGEADAGLVYASDAQAAGNEVQTFAVPGSAQEQNTYAIAVVEASSHGDLAAEWVDLVLSERGQSELAEAGFGPAPDTAP